MANGCGTLVDFSGRPTAPLQPAEKPMPIRHCIVHLIDKKPDGTPAVLHARDSELSESAATDKVGVAQQYNALAGKAAAFGAVDAKSANVENYVTEQALDGLFKMIAQQEETIRENPAAAATSLAKKVFGAL